LSIEQQVLAAYFIKEATTEETISQYKEVGSKLLKELFDFVQHDFVDTNQLLADDNEIQSKSSLLERIRLTCMAPELEREQIDFLEEEIARALRMFMIHLQVKGKLREFKLDYFV
jgi:Na+/phosphate symporter